jgi:hypothetical protein
MLEFDTTLEAVSMRISEMYIAKSLLKEWSVEKKELYYNIEGMVEKKIRSNIVSIFRGRRICIKKELENANEDIVKLIMLDLVSSGFMIKNWGVGMQHVVDAVHGHGWSEKYEFSNIEHINHN